VLLNLYRLLFWGKLHLAKKALSLKWDVAAAIALEMRGREENRRLPGINKDVDNLLEIVTRRLIELPTKEDLKEEEVERNAEIEAECAQAERSPQLQEMRADYFRLEAYFQGVARNEQQSAAALVRARQFVADPVPLKDPDIGRLEKKYKQLRRGNWKKIADRQSFRLDLNQANFGLIVSLVSTLFLLSGYLYNRFLYGSLGINVADFFTLTDYLTASIEQIRFAATGGALAILGMFFGLRSASRRSGFDASETERRSTSLLLAGAGLLGGVFALVAYLEDSPSWPNSLFFPSILVAIVLVKDAAQRFFVQREIALFSLVFVATYCIYLAAAVGTEILELKAGVRKVPRATAFHFSAVIGMNSPSTLLVGGNGTYLFFYDTSIRKVFVVPRSSVEYAAISKE